MRETRLYGSVRGAAGNNRPYRERTAARQFSSRITASNCLGLLCFAKKAPQISYDPEALQAHRGARSELWAQIATVDDEEVESVDDNVRAVLTVKPRLERGSTEDQGLPNRSLMYGEDPSR